ncbi:YDG/SRA domain-containing protein [Streptomyces rimosus]|uniref:YDG/SRA domain-containing protein n=1 Tax=Streptomyces rimosus TaxID=1927 RepID=UPI0018FEF698|nr:YDG/SRA domain-containing protein [Streptomyces rimosus]
MPHTSQERAASFLEALASLPTHHASGTPARYQPITILWALSRAVEGASRLTPWQNAKRDLHSMLGEYCPDGTPILPEVAFTELRHSPHWEFSGANTSVPDSGSANIREWLKRENPQGGLTVELYNALAADKALSREAVTILHERHFPDRRLGLLLLEAGLHDSFEGFGTPPHVQIGDTFKKRRTLARAKVHRPLQAGICGAAEKGAESIVVSGGYEDDEDYGDEIIYTGQGGRNETTKEQEQDQELTLGNAALATSVATGVPVRVIRGANGESQYSPESGLRYDGLYRVTDFWTQRGTSGFLVFRYRLRTVETNLIRDKAAAKNISRLAPSGNTTPARQAATTQRIVRSTAVANYVKKLHDYTCQVCGLRIETPTGAYAEAAHITPLGRPHNGPDEIGNVLCLCPNHHVAFDLGMLTIRDDRTVIQHGAHAQTYTLREIPAHVIDSTHLEYHRQHHEQGRQGT